MFCASLAQLDGAQDFYHTFVVSNLDVAVRTPHGLLQPRTEIVLRASTEIDRYMTVTHRYTLINPSTGYSCVLARC